MYDLNRPIRIAIDKQPASRYARVNPAGVFGDLWVVTGSYAPDARVYREARYERRSAETDIRNYAILIGHDYSGDPDTFRYMFYAEGGVTMEFYPNDEFEKNIEAFIEHEVRDPETGKPANGNRIDELMDYDCRPALATADRTEFTREEVILIYNEMDRYSFGQAHALGIDAFIFEALVRAWEAVKHFCDFAVAAASY